MYRAFLVFHRWLALAAGILVIVVAATGAAVVFEGPIGRATALRVQRGAAPLSLDTLAARAKAIAGGASIRMVTMGDVPEAPYGFLIGEPPRFRQVVLDPYTGAVVAPRGPSTLQAMAQRLHRWHVGLTGGTIGKALVSIATLASLVLALSGLVLWWREKVWRVNTSASWKRVNFDLHHALGLFAAVAILIMTTTGVWMLYAQTITPLVLKLDRTPPAPPPRAAPHGPDAISVSFDSTARMARAAIAGAALMNMQLQPDGVARIQMKYPEDHTPAGRSYVYVDRFAGAVLRVESTREAELGTRLIKLQRALHTGDVLGVPTQVLWFLSSLVLASQGVTGVLMWWNGRAARRAEAARRP
jgi:uncharacterized iron-regulated membrane protein